jgi:short-subunit dehydrogenase
MYRHFGPESTSTKPQIARRNRSICPVGRRIKLKMPILDIMARRLNGQIIVITGASAGIGRSLAIQLHARGAKLVLAARRIERLRQLNDELRRSTHAAVPRPVGVVDTGGPAPFAADVADVADVADDGGHLCLACDVADPAQCQALIDQAIHRFGKIDTLVCNAGYGLACPVSTTTHQQMLDIFRTNVLGTTDCIRSAVPHLIRNDLVDGHRGQVMIVSSAAGRRGLPWFGGYSATKSAQLGIAEALRVELHASKIAVTSVHPIGTDTEFFNEAERLSGVRVDTPGRSPVRQTADHVAARMLRAIERPCREVWPFRLARYALALNAAFPIVGDLVMRRALKSIDQHQKRQAGSGG